LRKAAALAAVALAVCVSPSFAADGAAVVRDVAQAYADWQVEESLYLRRKLGLPVVELPHVGRAKAEADAVRAAAMRAKLDAVDAAALPAQDRLTLDILRYELDGVIEAPRFQAFAFPVLSYTSPLPPVARVFTEWRFPDAAAVAAYEGLLEQLPRLVAEIRAQLEAQAAAGVRVPKPALDPVVALLRAFAAAPPASPFTPAAERLAALGAADAATAAARLAELAATRASAPLAELAVWLDGPYREAAPEGVGLGQYPSGADAYRWAIRRHTSLDLAPEAIHARGLAELARLRDGMEAVRREVGFAGTLDEFRATLRHDPRFFARTPEEFGERLMAPLARIEPKVASFFLVTPKAPYGVRRLDPRLEGSQTFGYYDPPTPSEPRGLYYFNGSRLEERTLLWAAGLIAHELVPGHHFQIARTNENEALPPLRREWFDTAFVEGWAEYASDLAGEMGIYADPYDRFGRLAMASFIATRLVVDTGMNALAWSRERAMEFMRENTFQSDTEIRSETLRYAVDMPGQALAYGIGSATIRDLRARAEERLGDRFDLRRFHETVLGSGALPLAVLARHVDDWIAEEARR
jgi:uncharacterized protein (DUF885 family)